MSFRAVSALFLAAAVGLWALRSLAASAAETNADPFAERTGTVTYREFLRSYWGAKWPELEQRLTSEQEARLEARVDRASLHPWTDVEPVLRERMREELQARRNTWDRQFKSAEDVDIDGSKLNPDHKQLPPGARAELAGIIAHYDRELEPLYALTFDLVAEANEAIWDEGRVQHHPLLEVDDGNSSSMYGRIVMILKLVHHPWCVTYRLNSDDWPALRKTLDRVAALGEERTQALQELTRSL